MEPTSLTKKVLLREWSRQSRHPVLLTGSFLSLRPGWGPKAQLPGCLSPRPQSLLSSWNWRPPAQAAVDKEAGRDSPSLGCLPSLPLLFHMPKRDKEQSGLWQEPGPWYNQARWQLGRSHQKTSALMDKFPDWQVPGPTQQAARDPLTLHLT